MKNINTLDAGLFFRQFATLISANIPIIQCCDMLETNLQNQNIRLLIQQIKRGLSAGKPLSVILSQHGYFFNTFICQLIRIGEQTGKLDTMLFTIAKHFEKNLVLTRKIKQALFYPTIVLLTGFLLLMCMLIFVIPLFAELFNQANAPLPPLTKAVFYLSDHCVYILVGLLSVFSGVACLVWIPRAGLDPVRGTTACWIPRMTALNLPIPFKKLHEKIMLARFTQNLAITFDAGIPVIDALRLTANTSRQQHFINVIQQVIAHINTGMQLHRALAHHALFPTLMIQMTKVGEQSGTLVFMLEKITDFLEAEIEQQLSQLMQLLEPLIMVVLGVLIGGLVVGMYLPIFKLGNTL